METSIRQTEEMADVMEYIAASVAKNTKRAYKSDWKAFATWCEGRGLEVMPATPEAVARYFAYMAKSGKRVATIERAKAAIHMAHDARSLADPTNTKGVKQTLQGIRRKLGTATKQKLPVYIADVLTMTDGLADNLTGKRDRAMLLLGFAGAFRRSELAGIEVAHLDFTTEGVKILLPFSKTDQEGAGRTVAILRGNGHCPVRALEEWLTAAGITAGPVFRNINKAGGVGASITPQSIALVVKKTAAAAGLDKAKYSGHSLRAGFVSQSAKNGATVKNIMRQTGHTSEKTVHGYIRIANVFEDNASGRLGL